MNEKKPKKRFLWLKITLLVLALGVMAYSGVVIYQFYQEGEEVRELMQQAFDTYVSTEPEPTQPSESEAGSDPTEAQPEQTLPNVQALRYHVDFAGLQEKNPDVCAWITVPALPRINFPVVWCGNDDAYLHHNWEGNYSYAGSIFVEGLNANDFLDYHTILYGHNMRDDGMFGTLESFNNEEFYRSNSPYIVVHTPESTILYEIFAAEYPKADDEDLYKIAYEDFAEFESFVEGLRERGIYDTGVEITSDDRFLSLSTCAPGSKTVKFTVHAKEIWRGNP